MTLKREECRPSSHFPNCKGRILTLALMRMSILPTGLLNNDVLFCVLGIVAAVDGLDLMSWLANNNEADKLLDAGEAIYYMRSKTRIV